MINIFLRFTNEFFKTSMDIRLQQLLTQSGAPLTGAAAPVSSRLLQLTDGTPGTPGTPELFVILETPELF
jgi:hypothetical protein